MSLNSERFPLTSGLRNKHNENDGFKVIFVCFVVFSIAITVALIVQIYYGEPEVVPHAAVSTDHKTCSGLSTELMRQGGSAVDAAVAAALCMAVVHPHSTGLGGGGFMLIHDHARNRSSVVDFRETAPAATDRAANVSGSGPRSVGVPGLLRGLELAHKRHGRLPWAELVRPSAQLARKGFAVSEQLAAALADHLTVSEARGSAGLSVFAGEAGLLRAGDALLLPDLADTLDRVQARGADALYDGPLTAPTVAELTSAGGLLTADDLAGYQPLQYEGLLRDYGNFSVLTTAAPSAGPALLAALELVWRVNASRAPDAALRYHRVTEALRLSMARFSLLGDPGSAAEVTNDTALLLEADTLANLSSLISDQSLVEASGLPPLDTPAASHVSVIDPGELYVSLVSGLGSFFGSKFRTTGGILFSNAMSAFYDPPLSSLGTLNVPEPGRRPLSTLSPAILMSPKVCGLRVVTGGSDASLLAQAVVRLLDPQENLTSSLEAPRLHVRQDSALLGVEADRPLQPPGAVLRALEAMGHQNRSEDRPYPSCNGITKYFDQLSSHSDSRGGGTAVRF